MTTYPIASLRWWLISNHLAGARVDSFLGFLRARVTLGLGGLVGPREIVETGGRAVWLVKFRQQTSTRAMQGVLIDRVCDLGVSGVALIGCAALFFSWLEPVESLLLLISACVAFVFIVPLLQTFLQKQLPSLTTQTQDSSTKVQTGFKSALSRLKTAVLQTLAISPQVVLGSLALSLIKFLILILRAAVLASAVGVAIEPAAVAAAAPVGQLANLLALTPGGFGAYEASWFGLLQLLGVAVAPAVAFVLLQRVCELFSVLCMLPALIGGPSTFGIKK